MTSTSILLNLFDSVIDLPAIDGSVVEQKVDTYIPTGKLTYFGPQMPTSAIAGLIADRADNILVLNSLVIHFDFSVQIRFVDDLWGNIQLQ